MGSGSGMATVLQLVMLAVLWADVRTAASSSSSSWDCKSSEERGGRNAGKGVSSGSPSVTSTDRRLVCSSMDLQHVPPPDTYPNRTVTLILNNNKIQELKNGSFLGLSSLERLDLRSNLISRIEPGAFQGLSSLKRLDLAKNLIGCLSGDMFRGLNSLIKLNLTGNVFSSLPPGTFDSLTSLKTLDFQTPQLLCDCNMSWLLRWLKERSVAVKYTRCSFPRALQGQLITDLRADTLTCDLPLELPSFQMTPSQQQVVFQGDSLPLQCRASLVSTDMQVLWFQNGKMVEPNATLGIYIEKNCSLIASALTIWNVGLGSAGSWECRVRTSRGNNTRTVNIMVLDGSAKYCDPDRVSNNKGEFRWPRTLGGITASMSCGRPKGGAGAGIYMGTPVDEHRALRHCSRAGIWGDGDYSRCPFEKDVTRILYIINQMPLNLTNAVSTARQLQVYTEEAANFSDKMDVIFVAQMIEKFGKFAHMYKELGDVMVDISSNLMMVDERVLLTAQREARACSRILESLQKIASLRLASGSQPVVSHNIALEAHVIKSGSFNGMTCTLFQKTTADRTQLSFKCNITGTHTTPVHKNTLVVATLQLPPSLLYSLGGSQSEEPVYKLHLLAFRNGKLFPPTGNSSLSADGKRRSVATPVLLARIDGAPDVPLVSPVNVTLRRFAAGSDATPALWNFTLQDGHGAWQTEGCRISHHDNNFTTLSCSVLGNYALLMDLRSEEQPYTFTPLHPVIYATAIILLLCLLVLIFTYVYHHRRVCVSRKCWHMLVNLCLHVFLTCGTFIIGINQTRYVSVCQAVGIVLHYSTLATALWSGVTARNIYKQVTRKAKRYEELDEPPPPPRPMLRFYLIGGGIPIIVCGITAAANIRNYGSQNKAHYCWMAWEPSLGAFFGPLAFIVFVDTLYFLLILLQLRRHPERRYELKEPPTPDEMQRLAGMESVTPPPLVENEQSFRTQLVGVASTLGLFLLLWAFGALAVSHDPAFSQSANSPSHNSPTPSPLSLTGACLFGLTALSLAAFLMTHHAASRSDVRRLWARSCSCCPRRPLHTLTLLPLPEAIASSAAAGGVAMVTGSSVSSRGNGEGKCGGEAESNCGTNRSAPSLRTSAKLTNLQVEAAAQSRTALTTTPHNNPVPVPVPAPVSNAGALLDNSLTEHSLDNDIKMHVTPIELQLRTNHTHTHTHSHSSVAPSNLANPSAPMAVSVPTVAGVCVSNGGGGRHHKNRARARDRDRASRLAVLREYAYDVPTSVESEGQAGGVAQRSRGGHQRSEVTRASRRAAYMAYRQRHMQQLQPDSSDASDTHTHSHTHRHHHRPRHERPQRPNSHSLPLPSDSHTHTHGSNLTHTHASSLAAGLGNGVSIASDLGNAVSTDPVLSSSVLDVGLGSTLANGGVLHSHTHTHTAGDEDGSVIHTHTASSEHGSVLNTHAAGDEDGSVLNTHTHTQVDEDGQGGDDIETLDTPPSVMSLPQTTPPSVMSLPLGLDSRPKVQSYGLNLASTSSLGPHKDNGTHNQNQNQNPLQNSLRHQNPLQNPLSLGPERHASGNIRTGLWKHETTV